MRYLQPYRLYEAAITEHPLLDGMQDTVGGRDLAALCGNDYRVDRTGKLVIEGLRGKTFVQQQPDGTWRHWVLSTGRVYAEGVYATLEECLAGCWLDFVLNSTSIRPQEMNMKAYRDLIAANLSELQGKALNKQGLRAQVVALIQRDFKHPIKDHRDFFDLPKWRPALDALGFTIDQFGSFWLFHSTSAIVNIFFTPEELESASPSHPKLLGHRLAMRFYVSVEYWEGLKMGIDPYGVALSVGGDLSTLPAFADEVWGGKRLQRGMTTAFTKAIPGDDFPDDVKQRMLALREFGVQLLQKVAAGGKVGDLTSTLLPLMQERDFTFAQAKRISEVMPELWAEYVKTHSDPDSVKHSALLADFF